MFLVKKGETQRSVSSSSMTVLPLGRAFVTKEERNVVTSHTGVGMSSYYYVGRLEKYQKCLLLMILSDKMDCRRNLIVIVVTTVLYYYSIASASPSASLNRELLCSLDCMMDFLSFVVLSDFLVFRYP